MATRTPKVLYEGQLPNSKTTLYTVPTSTKTYITSIIAFNTGGGTNTVTMYYKPGSTSRKIFAASVEAGGRLDYSGGDVLEDGDLIEGLATNATQVDCIIMGIEEA
jgi:hypothetical protein